ncbi:MAG: hypothetical protein ACRC1H_18280 [Caldilineaceae bacterium]
MAMLEQRHLEGPLRFRIRFGGTLSAHWFATMQDVTLSATRIGEMTETTITGEVPDDAALIGIVNMLYELGCGLISLETLGKAVPPDAMSALVDSRTIGSTAASSE